MKLPNRSPAPWYDDVPHVRHFHYDGHPDLPEVRRNPCGFCGQPATSYVARLNMWRYTCDDCQSTVYEFWCLSEAVGA